MAMMDYDKIIDRISNQLNNDPSSTQKYIIGIRDKVNLEEYFSPYSMQIIAIMYWYGILSEAMQYSPDNMSLKILTGL